MPDGEFLRRARSDLELAETIQFLNDPNCLVHTHARCRAAIKRLFAEHPGLHERYFCGSSRQFDALHYLLSDYRRDALSRSAIRYDPSQIGRAIFGTENLNADARSTQGFPIRLVKAPEVHRLAQYLTSIGQTDLALHYDVKSMENACVYKCGADLSTIWEELQGMCRVYEIAANNGEAIINMMD